MFQQIENLPMRRPAAWLCALWFIAGWTSPAWSAPSAPAYPHRAPLAQYQSAGPAEEAALARSAAPAAISGHAKIMAFGAGGYTTVAEGTNGFVCLVQRSWVTGTEDPEFWNPKVRSPACYNAAAVRSVLPAQLERTRWVLDGVSKDEIARRTKAEVASGRLSAPLPGSMCFMMSKQGYLADAAGHAHPHLMFFYSHAAGPAWGANLPGSPVAFVKGDPEPVDIYFVTVPKWSDGTPGDMAMH